MINTVKIGETVEFGSGMLGLIAGPCVIEGRDQCLRIAVEVASITRELGLPFVFKASFDKANRTSIDSYRGPGLEAGLEILAEVRDTVRIPVTTDIHAVEQVEAVANTVDMIQIPAFLSRQTDLLLAAAESGRPVNVKKGQFLAPADMKHVIAKLEGAGATGIMLTERGTSFGYNNLVVDFKGVCRLADFGHPVVFDVTHSLQLPGAGKGQTAGERKFAKPLACAAAAIGVNALFVEVHDDPPAALSDSSTQLPIEALQRLLEETLRVHPSTNKLVVDEGMES